MRARWILLALLFPYGWFLAETLAAVRLAVLDNQSARWPTAAATVAESSTADTCSRKGDVSHRLVYTYLVEGVRYTGATKSFSDERCYGPTDARRAASEYPVGTKLQVHVHPSSPRVSVVRANQWSPLHYFGLLAAFISLIAVPWVVWLYARRRLTPRSTGPATAGTVKPG